MDGPPAQALGVDPVDPAIMKRPPRPRNAPILSKRLFARVFFSAAIIVVGTLYMFLQETQDGRLSRRDQTMTFTTFVFLDLASAIQNRGLSCRLVQNKMLFLTCSISFLAQLGLIYLPFLQGVFQTQALSLRDFGTVLAFGLGSVTLHEGRRMWERSIIEEEDKETLTVV
ncbi:calcium-transporting atpase [Phaffia rhodozyma]|uniref:Calcium-transporting atpase n=1 Tax=Phaffia rhodozyma TaxID=264483 RepID=A0A0F7SGL4_PHARH|nr:calcium-transporting atpase [Phaffia rhodozyma]